MNRLASWLSSEEVERSRRFVFAEDRQRFVVCRGMLRWVLGTYLGLAPDEIAFEYGPRGKPRLRGFGRSCPLAFNVTHSGQFGGIAVAPDGDVGIDIEAVRPVRHFDQMMDKTLTVAEKQYVLSLPEGDRVRAFFRYWTRKEALLKALGIWLLGPLREIDIHGIDSPDQPVGLPPSFGSGRRLFLHELDLGAKYCGAVASQNGGPIRLLSNMPG